MKKVKKVEVEVCDLCGEDDATYGDGCMLCGKHFCYNCTLDESKVKKYNHATYFSGSGDGYYCVKCDTLLLYAGDNQEHNAYVLIENLRAEHESWYASWKQRSDTAEKKLKVFIDKCYAKRLEERKVKV